MIRLFDTHKIRNTQELSGRLWDFTLLTGEHTGEMRKVIVPSCLENYSGLGNYRGWSSYETDFQAEGNIRLEFKGVSHFARVFVDDREIAQHYGSYTPFDAYVQGLESGWHHLKVLVDNAFREEYALDMPNDYMSYGGISRGVVLEKLGEFCFNYIHITPIRESNGAWIIDVEVSCKNFTKQEQEVSFILKIADRLIHEEKKVLAPGEIKWEIKGLRIEKVSTWTIESPVLYITQAILVKEGRELDDWIDRVGFRTVRIEEKRILLNDKAVRLKGFCRHEDHPQYGCALPVQAIAYDLQLVKDMGGNAVRTSHYPNDELFLDLCDEMGILVWEENHARGFDTDKMQNSYFELQCEQTIHEMITAHYNHPSIIIWGILNECGSDSEYGRSCYNAQFDMIRRMDTSRPCSYASCRFNIDICQDLPDICSWNIYPYWYEEKSSLQMIEEIRKWQAEIGSGYKKPPESVKLIRINC